MEIGDCGRSTMIDSISSMLRMQKQHSWMILTPIFMWEINGGNGGFQGTPQLCTTRNVFSVVWHRHQQIRLDPASSRSPHSNKAEHLVAVGIRAL